jgi:hypothetical protein
MAMLASPPTVLIGVPLPAVLPHFNEMIGETNAGCGAWNDVATIICEYTGFILGIEEFKEMTIWDHLRYIDYEHSSRVPPLCIMPEDADASDDEYDADVDYYKGYGNDVLEINYHIGGCDHRTEAFLHADGTTTSIYESVEREGAFNIDTDDSEKGDVQDFQDFIDDYD